MKVTAVAVREAAREKSGGLMRNDDDRSLVLAICKEAGGVSGFWVMIFHRPEAAAVAAKARCSHGRLRCMLMIQVGGRWRCSMTTAALWPNSRCFLFTLGCRQKNCMHAPFRDHAKPNYTLYTVRAMGCVRLEGKIHVSAPFSTPSTPCLFIPSAMAVEYSATHRV